MSIQLQYLYPDFHMKLLSTESNHGSLKIGFYSDVALSCVQLYIHPDLWIFQGEKCHVYMTFLCTLWWAMYMCAGSPCTRTLVRTQLLQGAKVVQKNKAIELFFSKDNNGHHLWLVGDVFATRLSLKKLIWNVNFPIFPTQLFMCAACLLIGEDLMIFALLSQPGCTHSKWSA